MYVTDSDYCPSSNSTSPVVLLVNILFARRSFIFLLIVSSIGMPRVSGLGNGMVLSVKKPLPKPTLTKISDVVSRH